MKYSPKFFYLALLLFGFAACKKVEDLQKYKTGNAVTVTTSTSVVAAVPADSLKEALTVSWTSPGYATSPGNVKYLIQMDSTNRNFSKATQFPVSGGLSKTFTAKELNDMLLAYGFKFNTPYNIDVRVVSSYANNNELYVSNTVVVKMTPYLIPPKVQVPASGHLYLVGDATQAGWSNPVPTPSQEFTQVNSTTYEGTFILNGGKEYLALPVNGDWTHKYSVADKNVAGLKNGGNFGYDLPDNFPGPTASGIYKISFDFQAGKFTVTPVKVFATYPSLWVPGDYQGWTPDAAPTLASPTNNGSYEGYVNITPGSLEFKLTSDPDWSHTNYGDAGGGMLNAGGGGNLTVPTAGFYQLKANTTALTWSATKVTWSIIGSAITTGPQWSTDVDMAFSDVSKLWTVTTDLAVGEFKFRANHDWPINFGDDGADNVPDYGGANIAISAAGNYTISLYLSTAGNYYYMIKKNS
jgi:starch-binding outer membrane protein SusE/F